MRTIQEQCQWCVLDGRARVGSKPSNTYSLDRAVLPVTCGRSIGSSTYSLVLVLLCVRSLGSNTYQCSCQSWQCCLVIFETEMILGWMPDNHQRRLRIRHIANIIGLSRADSGLTVVISDMAEYLMGRQKNAQWSFFPKLEEDKCINLNLFKWSKSICTKLLCYAITAELTVSLRTGNTAQMVVFWDRLSVYFCL